MADSWTYDEVAFKASHNSYDRQERPITEQLSWSAANPYQAGCRGLEIDLVEADNLWLWSVQHVGVYSADVNVQLTEILRHLRQWSQLHPRHDVTTVTLDLKSVTKDLRQFPAYFDLTISEFLGEDRLYTPAQMIGDHPNLMVAATSDGWPTLGDLRGKFIFCLSGDERTKQHYARAHSRLCFADTLVRSGDSLPNLTSGDRIFFNFDARESWAWNRPVEWIAEQRGIVSRAYLLNSEDLWQRVKSADANQLATDKIRNHRWAKIGGSSPFRRLTRRPGRTRPQR